MIRKTHRLEIRLTNEQNEEITKNSKEHNMTKSQYVINRTITHPEYIEDFRYTATFRAIVKTITEQYLELERENKIDRAFIKEGVEKLWQYLPSQRMIK